MKKASCIFMLAACLVILVCGCHYEGENKEDSKTEQILAFGDDFSQVKLFDGNGEEAQLQESSKYKLVFVVDSLCGTCRKQLEVVERLQEFYEPYLSVSVVWEEKMLDENALKKYNIPKNINYVLKANKIVTSTPTAFILDEDNKICFVSTNMDNVVRKLNDLEEVDIGVVRERVCRYFSKQNETSKDTLVYFALQGCGDCEKADMIIDRDVKEKYNMIKIYDSGAYGEEEYVDLDNIYQSIFEIEWYPSFLLINKDGKYTFVGETKNEELKNILLNGV